MSEPFPTELLEHILAYLHASPFDGVPNLAVCARVNKTFFDIASKFLYGRIVLSSFDPQNPSQTHRIPPFDSLSQNPKLASHVHHFSCFMEPDDPDWLDSIDQASFESIVKPALDNMTSLRTLYLTPNKMAEHFMLTAHKRPASLQELHVLGPDPCNYNWLPDKVMENGAFSRLTSFQWTFAFELDDHVPYSSYEDIVSFIVAALELSCPSLRVLKLGSLSSLSGLRDRWYGCKAGWTTDLRDWMKNNADSFDSVHRLAQAFKSRKSKSKLKLEHLGLNIGYPPDICDNDVEYKKSVDWLLELFRPQLSTIKKLELATRNHTNSLDHSIVRMFCSSASPQLQSLVITEANSADYYESNAQASQLLDNLTVEFSNAPKMNLADSLQHLEVDNLNGLFSQDVVDVLQRLTRLKSLSVLDFMDQDTDLIGGGWLDWDRYHERLRKFIGKLPFGLLSLKIVLNAHSQSTGLMEKEDFVINGPALCKRLRSLRTFHFECWTAPSDGCIPRHPSNEVYIHRLPPSDSALDIDKHKIVASTYLEDQYEHSHMKISKREFVTVEADDDAPFEGEDEIAPWTYTQKEVDFIRQCGCRKWPLADPKQGDYVDEDSDVDMYSDDEEES